MSMRVCLRDEEEVMALYNPSVVSYALSSSSTQRQGCPGSWCEKKSPSRPPSSQSKIGSRSAFQNYIPVLWVYFYMTEVDDINELVSIE